MATCCLTWVPCRTGASSRGSGPSAEMGAWLGQFVETIYGTRGGPYMPPPGASTRKNSRVYLHVLD